MALEVLLLFQLLAGVDEAASSNSPLTLLEGEAMRRLLEPIEIVPAFKYNYSLINAEHLK